MQEGLAKWRPALILVGVTVVVIGLLIAFGGGADSNSAAPATSTSASSATAPTMAASSAAPTSASVAPPPPSVDSTAAPPPTVSATTANSWPAQPPGPADPASVFVPPETKPITGEWQAQKTEQALVVVQQRADKLTLEIADLEKSGKTQEAAEKKVLLKRLTTQIADMKTEIAQYKAGDAGVADAAPR